MNIDIEKNFINIGCAVCSQLLPQHGFGTKSSHHYISRRYKLRSPKLIFLQKRRVKT